MLHDTQKAAQTQSPTLPQTAERAARLEAARAKLPQDLVNRFERGLYETDQRIDRVVQAFDELPRGMGFRMLERAMRERNPWVPGAPAALSELLEPLLQPPAWLDLQLVDRGAAIWWRFFPAKCDRQADGALPVRLLRLPGQASRR